MNNNKYGNAVDVVYCTNDYSIFKHLQGNRVVASSRVRRIRESIDAVGYVLNPIVVNENMEVIDGQGRLEVLEDMMLPVYYVVAEGAGVDECRRLNIGQSNWKLVDYVRSFADEGNESYVHLNNLINEYREVSPECIVGVITNRIIASGADSNRKIRNGELVVTANDAKIASDLLDFIVEHMDGINNFVGTKRVTITGICWALRNGDVNRARLGKIIDEKFMLFAPISDSAVEYFLNDMSDIYNKGLAAKNCVYLSETYKRYMRENA